MPDNCKNFVETLVLVRKGWKGKELGSAPSLKKPTGPHVLEVAQGLQDVLDAGVVNNRADLARRLGASHARVTQLLNLLKLPDQVRSEILCLPEVQQRCFSERRLRSIARTPSAVKQIRAFERLKAGLAE